MDQNVIAWSRHIDSAEAAAEQACYAEALRNGHDSDVADLCDDGSVGCINCPFKKAA